MQGSHIQYIFMKNMVQYKVNIKTLQNFGTVFMKHGLQLSKGILNLTQELFGDFLCIYPHLYLQ